MLRKVLLTFTFLSACSWFYTVRANETNFFYLKEYPSYREAVIFFLKHYNTDSLKQANFTNFRFARTPQGWFVYPEGIRNDSIIITDTINLWVQEEGFILKGISAGVSPISALDSVELLSNRNLYDYSIHPFYAYEGWNIDVTDFYRTKRQRKLTENEIYGIGRAYSQTASDILWAHSKWSPRPDSNNVLTKEDLTSYIRNSQQAIEYFQRLYDKNPDYHTIVGNIDIKLHNEIMAKWYELMIFGYKEYASSLLDEHLKQQNLYDDFWRSYARSILEDTEKGSILFTNGDNDTYPLLWLQFIKGIRKDVAIINTSLLTDPTYYQSLLNSNLYDHILSSSISKEAYEDLSNAVIYVSGEENRVLPFNIIRREVLASSPFIDDIHINTRQYYSTTDKGGNSDTILMQPAFNNYILPRQFLVMSITDENIQQRDIRISTAAGQEYASIFAGNELFKSHFTIDIHGKDSVNEQLHLFDKYDAIKDSTMLHKILRERILPFPDKNSTAQKQIFANIMISEALLIAELSRLRTYHIEEMSEKFFLKYPPSESGINLSYILLVHLLYENGELTRAHRHLQEVLPLLWEKAGKTELRDDEFYDISVLNSLAEMIKILMRNSELIPEIQKKQLIEISGIISDKMPDSFSIEML